MTAGGWAWLAIGGRAAPLKLWRSRNVARDFGIGVAVGLGIVLLSRAAAASGQARKMEAEFGRMIGRPPLIAIPMIALASAVGEEMLFRGALQAHVGIWIQALIFGALHIPFTWKLAAWPVFAALVGLLFGWMTEGTGNLWSAVLAHATINQVNLTLIAGRR
jgi:hypothetical protein